jgi:hypothetical protein
MTVDTLKTAKMKMVKRTIRKILVDHHPFKFSGTLVEPVEPVEESGPVDRSAFLLPRTPEGLNIFDGCLSTVGITASTSTATSGVDDTAFIKLFQKS